MNTSETAFLVPRHDGLGRTDTLVELDDAALVGEQASARGGMVRIRLNGDRVTISGQAVTVARTRLLAWP